MGRLTSLFSKKSSPSTAQEMTSYERANIMEEMFKKNLELANKNKTLSILEQIDEIILSKVTDTQEIAHKVTKLLVDEAGFRIAGIYILDEKKILQRLEVSFTEKMVFLNKQELKKLIDDVASHKSLENILYAAMTEKEMKYTTNLYASLADSTLVANRGAQEIQNEAELKAIYVYPLMAREEAIGVMVISLGDTIDKLKENEKDLMSRLACVIGIAIDNALLFNRVKDTGKA